MSHTGDVPHRLLTSHGYPIRSFHFAKRHGVDLINFLSFFELALQISRALLPYDNRDIVRAKAIVEFSIRDRVLLSISLDVLVSNCL